MRNVIRKLVPTTGAILFIAISIGLFFQVGESIPDNAEIDVFPNRRYWLPHSLFIKERLEQDLTDPDKALLTLDLISEITPASWWDVKDGKYRGFKLPPGWGSYKENFTTGYNIPLLLYLVSRPKSRWNSDGSWNY